MSHGDVMDCAVVGLPDAQVGELPLAYVVPRPSASITPEQLQDFVKGNISYQFIFVLSGYSISASWKTCQLSENNILLKSGKSEFKIFFVESGKILSL